MKLCINCQKFGACNKASEEITECKDYIKRSYDTKIERKDEQVIDPHKIGMLYKEPTYRSVIKIGDNFEINITKKFNWFNRLMMKLVFGWEVKNR